MASVVARFFPLGAAERKTLTLSLRPVLRNWSGFEVGSLGSPRQFKPPRRQLRPREVSSYFNVGSEMPWG